jgi:sialic acid synthase SpsE
MIQRRVELIAEVASNHGGSLDLAREFIYRFADAGADYVKFQATRVKHLRPSDPQFAWFERAELSDDLLAQLAETCTHAGVKFLCTVNHADDVPMLRALSPLVKIGAGESKETTLRDAVRAAKFDRVFVSNPPMHMWNFNRVWPITTVSRYPTPAISAKVDIGHCGWSDHCVGLDGCFHAIISGARVIEKHVCLSNQARAQSPWESTLEEFRRLRAFASEDESRFIGRWQHQSEPVLA